MAVLRVHGRRFETRRLSVELALVVFCSERRAVQLGPSWQTYQTLPLGVLGRACLAYHPSAGNELVRRRR
jgi:hypothetical protein